MAERSVMIREAVKFGFAEDNISFCGLPQGDLLGTEEADKEFYIFQQMSEHVGRYTVRECGYSPLHCTLCIIRIF